MPSPPVPVRARLRSLPLRPIASRSAPAASPRAGCVFLHPEPFWYWSEAQTDRPARPGSRRARRSPPKASSSPTRLVADAEAGGFRVEGGALAPGDRIEFVYGAGPRGAKVDRYADRGARILIATDANGDGYRQWVPESARLDVVARRGRLVLAHGPAEAAPGEEVEIVVSITDAQGNRAAWPGDRLDAQFEIEVAPESTLRIDGPSTLESVAQSPTSPHRLSLSPSGNAEGVLRVTILGRGALEGARATVAPIVVRKAPTQRLVWADLHGHSGLSDGTGTPADYLAYAKEIARLDVVALTDHDHWGLHPLDEDPAAIVRLFDTIDRAERPGRFVTLPGYEWTSWLHGHRHVLYFDPARPGGDADSDARPVFSSIDPATDRPDELWAALGDRAALTFAHHTAGEPVATNWSYAPDPVLEPVVEIASVHGQSESFDATSAVRGGIQGAFALDALKRGARLGFVGSGDSHDGHPGLARIAAGQSGLAGLFVESLSRDAVLDALRRKRSFATNGSRPWLDVRLDDTPMGGTFEAIADPKAVQTLHIRYEATAPLGSIEIVRGGHVAKIRIEPEQAWSLELERKVPALRPGEFQYVRFVERDGGRAWSSPIFATAAANTADTPGGRER